MKILWVSFALYGAGLTLYWVTDREFPIKIYNGRIEPVEVERGGKFTVRWDMEKTRTCVGESLRTLNGECGSFEIFEGRPSGPVMPRGEIILRVKVPEEAHPGVCYYDTRITYRCNPIHYIYPMVQLLPTIPFKVIEAKK